MVEEVGGEGKEQERKKKKKIPSVGGIGGNPTASTTKKTIDRLGTSREGER